MTTNHVTGFPAIRYPLSQVTPFTYRDGMTYLELLEQMRDYMTRVLVPELDENIGQLVAAVGEAIDGLDTRIVESEARFQSLIDETVAWVNDVIDTINDKTGAIDIQRITLTDDHEITFSDAWPNGHPIIFQFTQDDNGNHAVAYDGEPVYVRTYPGAVTNVVAIREDGAWTIRDNRARVVKVDDFGTGHLAVERALADGSGGVVEFSPEKTYHMGDVRNINIASGTRINGNGARVVFDGDATGSIAHRFRAQGVAGDNVPLTETAPTRSHSLKLASTAGIAVGDILLLGSNEPNEGGDPVYLQGEAVTVRKVLPGEVLLRERTVYEYSVDKFAYATIVKPVRDVVIDSLTIEDAGVPDTADGDYFGQRGITFNYSDGCKVTNCKFINTDSAAVCFYDSVNFLVRDNDIYTTLTPSYTLQKVYTISVFKYARNGLIAGNVIRHGATGVAFSDSGPGHGNSIFVTVSNNRFVGCHRGISTHSNSNYLTIEGNTFDSCTFGVNYRVRHGIINNNQFVSTHGGNASGHAILLDEVAGDLTINGNLFDGVFTAVKFNASGRAEDFENIGIVGNTANDVRNITLDLDYTETGTVKNIVIVGNTFNGCIGDVIRLYGKIRGAIVQGNNFGDGPGVRRFGVRCMGVQDSIVSGNVFGQNTAPVSFSNHENSDAKNNLVIGNLWTDNVPMSYGLSHVVENLNTTNPDNHVGATIKREIYSIGQADIAAGTTAAINLPVADLTSNETIVSVKHIGITTQTLDLSAIITEDNQVKLLVRNYGTSSVSLPTRTVELTTRRG